LRDFKKVGNIKIEGHSVADLIFLYQKIILLKSVLSKWPAKRFYFESCGKSVAVLV
jgi:hypothetical protein